MADAPAYTTVPGRIPELLKKIRETGVPPKATNEWLRSVGFKSSNDRSLISVLKQIGFIDAQGVPQPAWREYRGAQHREVLGRAVRLGYDSLFSTYPDAHSRSNTDLSHVFSTKTSAGKQAIDKMVATFKNLAKEATFDGVEPADIDDGRLDDSQDEGSGNGTRVVTRTVSTRGVTINVNIQLTIPETSDDRVFDAFFASMRKHLIDDNLT